MDKRVIIYMIFLGLSFYLIQTFFRPKNLANNNVTNVVQERSFSQKEINSQEDTAEKSKYFSKEENFYVIENKYQQVVFSNVGGSIVEINLPLKSKDNDSIIRPIEFDNVIEKDYPQNAQFPQKSYYTSGFIKHAPKLGGYYPLLRRSIYDKNKNILSYVQPKYYSLNITDENDSSLANINFKVTRFEKNLIEFVGYNNKRKIIKTFFFDEKTDAPFAFYLKVKVEGNKNTLWLASGVLDVEFTSNASISELKYRTVKKNKNVTEKISLPKGENIAQGNYVDWISDSNGFLGIIIDSLNEIRPGYKTKYIPGTAVLTRLTQIDSVHNLYPAQKYPGYEVFLPLASSSNEITFRIFAGPYQGHMLKALDDIYSKPLTGYTPNYISVKSVKGWFSFASEPFSKFLLMIMRLFYQLTYSWGLSIILLTLIFRIMLYPLNSWSIKSTTRMQEITPLLKIIDAKYKKDPRQANIEKIKLYKEKGANPFSGCLPILIQLPFLLGMFNLLKSSFELRGASFISGWIDNLAAPDVLFSWEYPLFFIGNELHLLPLALGVVMFIQSKMNVKLPEDKTKLTDQQKQQVLMAWLMPLLFVVIFYKAAAGLNIYFFFSMFLGIVQQWYMTKIKKKKELSIKLIKK